MTYPAHKKWCPAPQTYCKKTQISWHSIANTNIHQVTRYQLLSEEILKYTIPYTETQVNNNKKRQCHIISKTQQRDSEKKNREISKTHFIAVTYQWHRGGTSFFNASRDFSDRYSCKELFRTHVWNFFFLAEAPLPFTIPFPWTFTKFPSPDGVIC